MKWWTNPKPLGKDTENKSHEFHTVFWLVFNQKTWCFYFKKLPSTCLRCAILALGWKSSTGEKGLWVNRSKERKQSCQNFGDERNTHTHKSKILKKNIFWCICIKDIKDFNDCNFVFLATPFRRPPFHSISIQ